MELFEDFGGPDGPDATARALGQAERLLACYQQVLGHELPNQLVALGGLARVLEETQAGRLDDDGRACLERLADLARKAGGLVSAAAEVGRLCRPADPEGGAPAVSLPEAAREAAAEVHLKGGGAAIDCDFPADLPPLTVPHRALYQVLIHLLRNATRAALPDRPLCIRLGGRPHPEGVELWVRDNGRGLPEGAFEPFAGPRPVEPADAGPGLGLFLVRQLVASWGGALRVGSEPGQGTTFTVLVRNRTRPGDRR